MKDLFYTIYISVDLAHHKIFCAKVSKGGINSAIEWSCRMMLVCLVFGLDFGAISLIMKVKGLSY